MTILAIESSCDDSSIALFASDKGILKNIVYRQSELHARYGGVVPGLASREHLETLPLILKQVREDGLLGSVEGIAVTYGPGLAGCLALGVGLAKSIAFVLKKPIIGVNHLIGHAFSPFIQLHEKNPGDFFKVLGEVLPHLGLLVSGSNTILFEINQELSLTILARTIDDAAGEAIDKGARLLGLPYPGGPLIQQHAASGKADAFEFPRAFKDSLEPKFSFSGLKTSLRYRLESMSSEEIQVAYSDICASYQEAVVDALISKTRQFLKRDDYRSIGLSGGVANNFCLRGCFQELGKFFKKECLLVEPQYSCDNAGMIAFGAFMAPQFTISSNLSIVPALPLVCC